MNELNFITLLHDLRNRFIVIERQEKSIKEKKKTLDEIAGIFSQQAQDGYFLAETQDYIFCLFKNFALGVVLKSNTSIALFDEKHRSIAFDKEMKLDFNSFDEAKAAIVAYAQEHGWM